MPFTTKKYASSASHTSLDTHTSQMEEKCLVFNVVLVGDVHQPIDENASHLGVNIQLIIHVERIGHVLALFGEHVWQNTVGVVSKALVLGVLLSVADFKMVQHRVIFKGRVLLCQFLHVHRIIDLACSRDVLFVIRVKYLRASTFLNDNAAKFLLHCLHVDIEFSFFIFQFD